MSQRFQIQLRFDVEAQTRDEVEEQVRKLADSLLAQTRLKVASVVRWKFDTADGAFGNSGRSAVP